VFVHWASKSYPYRKTPPVAPLSVPHAATITEANANARPVKTTFDTGERLALRRRIETPR
jgi:hypothetical protein